MGVRAPTVELATWARWSGLSRCSPSQQSGKTTWSRTAAGARRAGNLRPPSTVQAQPTSSVGWGSVLVASPPIIISPVGNGTTSSGSTPGRGPVVGDRAERVDLLLAVEQRRRPVRGRVLMGRRSCRRRAGTRRRRRRRSRSPEEVVQVRRPGLAGEHDGVVRRRCGCSRTRRGSGRCAGRRARPPAASLAATGPPRSRRPRARGGTPPPHPAGRRGVGSRQVGDRDGGDVDGAGRARRARPARWPRRASPPAHRDRAGRRPRTARPRGCRSASASRGSGRAPAANVCWGPSHGHRRRCRAGP